MAEKVRKIELLAPARDLSAGISAIDFGADALYIGASRFGARQSASNTVEDIARLTQYAHTFGVRVYATLNTLIYEHELAQAEQLARELCQAGVDALIVQDMAFLRMNLSGVEFHASTQTCNTSAEKVKFLQESGFSRVVLERGLTIEEIRKIHNSTDVALEAFVHGAICVCFSGQCYMSQSMNGRSGNRGECAQSCRMPYDLRDGNGKLQVEGKHLLSLRDLNLSDHIPHLISSGVDSLKIEGRLKDDVYVRNIVSYYRKAIDLFIDQWNSPNEKLVRSSVGLTTTDFEPDPRRSFSRGYTQYFLEGRQAGVASFDTPKAIGMKIGDVAKVKRDSFRIDTQAAELSAGDGICFINRHGELVGTNINGSNDGEIYPNRMDDITQGITIYRNRDHQFETAIKRSRTKRLIDIAAHATVNLAQLSVKLTDCEDVQATAELQGSYPLAANRDTMEHTLRQNISKNGDMPFDVKQVYIEEDISGMPFIPISEINHVRRESMQMLLTKREQLLPARYPGSENLSHPFPDKEIFGEGNITNSLAASFYKDHGVESFEWGNDLNNNLKGKRVMNTSYCIRRELAECLHEKHTLKEPLQISSAGHTYRLEFDCQQCRMSVICE